MKKLIAMSILLGAVSCGNNNNEAETDSPESVAQQALEIIGTGRFDEIGLAHAGEDVFSGAYHDHDLALRHLSGGEKGYDRDTYFDTDLSFDDWELIDKSEHKTDIYFYWDWICNNDDYSYLMQIFEQEGGESGDGRLKLIESNDYNTIILRKGVGCHRLTYKAGDGEKVVIDVIDDVCCKDSLSEQLDELLSERRQYKVASVVRQV